MLAKYLVIFSKAPRQGAAKTRLSATLGRAEACRISRAIAFKVINRLSNDTRWTCVLAVTPDQFAHVGRFWPYTAKRVAQGGGNLGVRMARPVRELPPGPVVMVGSDIPSLNPEHIVDAFRALGKAHFVFGPARDGGYWLIGMRRRPTTVAPFPNVRWSSPSALADTLGNIDRRFRVAFLEELEDIDDISSWHRWSKRKQRITQIQSWR